VLILYKGTQRRSEKKKRLNSSPADTIPIVLMRRIRIYIYVLCIFIYFIFHQGPNVVAEVVCMSPDNNERANVFTEINIIINIFTREEKVKRNYILSKYFNQSSELII